MGEFARPWRMALSNRRECCRSPRFVEAFGHEPCLRAPHEQRPVEGLSVCQTPSEYLHAPDGPLTPTPDPQPGVGHEMTRGLRADLRAMLEEDLDQLLSVHAEPQLSDARKLLGYILND